MTIPKYIHFTQEPSATLKSILKEIDADKTAILVDENTSKHCLHLFDNIDFDLKIEIKSGEKNKTLDTCQVIWQKLTESGFSRKSLLVNLGGGVIGDMGGFCASTFKRGIRFINIPTTLLAAVDANIGGKLGIDFMGFKNHIGVFNDPDAVIVTDVFLNTLPSRELRSGFAEVIKHGLISDKDYWNELKKNDFPDFQWIKIIERSISIKGAVVAEDPLEKGLRKILNFGHTLGHAIETSYLQKGESLLHGEAIACGMILEAHLSNQKKLINEQTLEEISIYLLNLYGPIQLPKLTQIQELMSQDKKNSGAVINFSLIDGVGSCVYNQSADANMIIKSMDYYENIK